jgi:hypothetical protein
MPHQRTQCFGNWVCLSSNSLLFLSNIGRWTKSNKKTIIPSQNPFESTCFCWPDYDKTHVLQTLTRWHKYQYSVTQIIKENNFTRTDVHYKEICKQVLLATLKVIISLVQWIRPLEHDIFGLTFSARLWMIHMAWSWLWASTVTGGRGGGSWLVASRVDKSSSAEVQTSVVTFQPCS